MNMTDIDMAYLSPPEKCDMCGENRDNHSSFYHPFKNAFVDDSKVDIRTPNRFPTYISNPSPEFPPPPSGCNGNWTHYPRELIEGKTAESEKARREHEYQCQLRKASIAKYQIDAKANCWPPFEKLKGIPPAGRCDSCYPPRSQGTARPSCLR